MKPIPYGRQQITDEDITSVVNVLKSDFLTQGPQVPMFESRISNYCNSKYAVAVNSATSALHIACMALELSRDDYLWTSSNSFVASANCAIYCGAKVDFIDINKKTYNIDVSQLEKKLQKAKLENKLPKIVIPVHLTGQSCQMEEIYALSIQYGFKIIEDASHAIGGSYQNKKIGNCSFSDITVFSFHPVKIITTGEGGVAVTNDNNLYQKMVRYRSHGITNNNHEFENRDENQIWNYQQVELGYNYRMTDMQAALGISQFGLLNDAIQKRHLIADKYNKSLCNLNITLPWQHPDTHSSYHLYVIMINEKKCGKTQKFVYKELRKLNILVNLHYIPIHRQPFYVNMGFEEGYCRESEIYFEQAISLPIYPGLTDNDQNYIVNSLKKKSLNNKN